MRNKVLAPFGLFLILLLVGCAQAAQAAQTSVPIRECRNCSDAQMEQFALAGSGFGVRIVYNLASGHIFKYNIYLESGCLNQPEGEDDAKSASTRAACNPNPTRQIDRMALDSVLIDPFAAMVEIYDSEPALLVSPKISANISDVGYDPSNPPQSFDPYAVAYDQFSGPTFQSFLNAATQYFNDNSALNLTNNNLSSLVYDVFGPLRNAVIQISASPGAGLDLSTILKDPVIDFTAQDGSYIRVRFVHQGNTPEYDAVFVGAWDATNVPLPTNEQANTPGFNRIFRGPRGGEGSNNMLNALHRYGGFGYGADFAGTCTHGWILTCITEPTAFRSCRRDCIP
jgi:hypothetical protein